jgi:hypothetical protein
MKPANIAAVLFRSSSASSHCSSRNSRTIAGATCRQVLTDPIFQGLAISLLFGLASSTLLTVLVIPAIYRALRT